MNLAKISLLRILLLLSLNLFAKEYHISDDGAFSDAEKVNTMAIHKAIDVCSTSGEGNVGVDDGVTFTYVEYPGNMPEGFVWKSEIPATCPFPQSNLFDRVYFTGRFGDYLCGDTFYPSWAEDGNLYSPWTDGVTDQISSRSHLEEDPSKVMTGHAVMKGDDPQRLLITNPSPPEIGSALPYQGRYPAGTLVHNGVWYYGSYCLSSGNPDVYANPTHNGFTYNWPVLGPIPGFRISHDYGKTWTDSPLTPENPLFPEPATRYAAVKMGAPHFVDFGKNMEYSPDGKAYLLGIGALDNDPEPRPSITKEFGKEYAICDTCKNGNFKNANLSWISADQIYMARVTPSPETINDIDSYEFFAGHNKKGQPIWTNNFDEIKPLLEWNNNMGCVTATYVPGLKKYFMCVTDGWPTTASMDSYILEADDLTGPWKIVTYMENFGEQSYFLNFPSKFISEDGKNMWLCHSANFWNGGNGFSLSFKPAGGRYGLSMHEMQFLSKDEKDPQPKEQIHTNIFEGNIAKQAEITVSSTKISKDTKKLNDEHVPHFKTSGYGGWPKTENIIDEWVKLEWKEKQNINRILLFDDEGLYGCIQSGQLIFSDGSIVNVDRELPSTACEGLEIKFKPKNVEWVQFKVVTTYTKRAKVLGLSEFAVFAVTNQ